GGRRITVRVVGGGGRDVFRDEVSGPAGATLLYDGGAETAFLPGGSATLVRASHSPPLSWWEERRELDWGTQTIPQPTASYDDDRGLVLMPGLDYRHFDFGKSPFGTRIQLKAGWSLALHEPVVDLRYLGRRVLLDGDLRLHVRWSGIEIINFYGFGNETTTNRSKDFHRISHKQVSTTLALSFGEVESTYVELGPTFVYTSTDTTSEASFIALEDPYGGGRFARIGVRTAFGFDSRDHRGRPTRGTRFSGELGSYPGLLDVESGFQEARGQISGYFSPLGDRPVLALRAAGEKLWGEVPFPSAAFLGGPTTVRSLRLQRYAGDALLLGSAELRMPVWRVFYPMPLDIGLYALADVGRVWAPGESSGVWHSALGGGVFFGLIDRSEVVRVAVARGAGRTALMAGLGFIY
ncbi:MAG: BamA/TamA family outer membrane protein, partial [Longimicrobiales bacterium]|nr:BamA/TamA family outer membrane protein [Longimicrobiales bacterium]